jgi:REP element-mobilizing transposase RayT
MATVEERLAQSLSESLIQKAAFVWVMESMDDHYHNFIEMLFDETDDRWLIQHYLALKLNVSCDAKKESAMWELGWFLDKAIDCQELFAEHAKDAGKFLKYIYPEDKEIEELFEIYEKIININESSCMHSQKEMIEPIVRNNKYARGLFLD